MLVRPSSWYRNSLLRELAPRDPRHSPPHPSTQPPSTLASYTVCSSRCRLCRGRLSASTQSCDGVKFDMIGRPEVQVTRAPPKPPAPCVTPLMISLLFAWLTKPRP